jgi:ATP-binding cassette subfamily C protein
MLTGPLFMLQVYDRVLPSHSEPTLLALSIFTAGLFGTMAILDLLRGKVAARIGAQLQCDLDATVFRASMIVSGKVGKEAVTALHDLEAIRRFMGSSLLFAFFDLPFALLFFAAMFLFHPYLGWLAIAGALTLLCVMLLNQYWSLRPSEIAARAAAGSTRVYEQLRTQVETVKALGMTHAGIVRWRKERVAALEAEIRLSDCNGGFGALTKALRLFLQSAMLALGAWLVIHGDATGGVMMASSILLGRALSPIEQLVGGWASVVRARKGWSSLEVLLATIPLDAPRTQLSRPTARLDVEDLMIIPPGETKPTLRGVTFAVEPGHAVGVIGESASGKSSLARSLVGLWRPAAGDVRLGGARLDQYDEDVLASYIGYLPQDVVLFDGTVAQNIARLAEKPDSAAVIKAATLAGAHDMILALPKGYDTPVGLGGARLSGGQKQRIGLARALFGDPVIVVLDEPNSNLDAPGSDSVNAAIRELKSLGRIVVIMAHRPAAIAECDLILMIRQGQIVAFGPRDEVLRRNVANHTQLAVAPQKHTGMKS